MITLKREGPLALVEWEDSGPGVPAADLPRLTDRLFRVEGSRSRTGGGSGLGLAIARAIVEGHGGTLEPFTGRIGGLGIRIVLPAANGARDG
jgi:two-component system sensor histidine kinase BaeS